MPLHRRLAGAACAVGLMLVGCGAAKPANPLHLIEASLAQEYFDLHHALPSTQEEHLNARLAHGMLARLYSMPPPSRPGKAPRVDLRRLRSAQGRAAVDEALLAAYILHFGALPPGSAQAQIALLAGSGRGPLPVFAPKG